MMTRFILFYSLLLLGFFSLQAKTTPVDSITQSKKVFTVVLDAGHGGRDPGKLVVGVREKDIALKVVKYLGAQLKKQQDVNVIYTRTTDTFITLKKRAEIANKAKADLFVSVHCNAAGSHRAKGNETWVLGLHRNDDNLEVVKRENAVILLEENYKENYHGFDPNDPSSFAANLIAQEEYLDNSIEMATKVQTEFQKKLKRKNRGVKQAGFAVLRLSYMPSVLIETGFLTNKEERQFLNSTAGQQKVAQSVYKAVMNYKANRILNDFYVEPVKPVAEQSKEQMEETKIDTSSLHKGNKEEIKQGVVYKIQISASTNKLATKSYNFKGLEQITREKSGKVYRYYTGEYNRLSSAKNQLSKAKKKGYTSAFICQFDQGIRSRL